MRHFSHEVSYFINFGASCGQPVFLVDNLRYLGIMTETLRVIAVNWDTNRNRMAFLRQHAVDMDCRDASKTNIRRMETMRLMTSLTGAAGITYGNNNLVWESKTILALEKLISGNVRRRASQIVAASSVQDNYSLARGV